MSIWRIKPPLKIRKTRIMVLRVKKYRHWEVNFLSDLLSPSDAYLSRLIPSLFIHPPHPFYNFFVCVWKGVESFLKLWKHLAEKSQGTIQQIFPLLEKSALTWQSQVCTTASWTSFVCVLTCKRQVPLCIAGLEAFLDPSAKGCSENTWAVASDETGENVSLCTVLAQSG